VRWRRILQIAFVQIVATEKRTDKLQVKAMPHKHKRDKSTDANAYELLHILHVQRPH